ncbi:MAG: glycosyltransferase family 9 protein [Actinomycetota bacterium]|nr:glycosyltransferase family 9 protein [Actinomycetota bacterium]
MSVLVGAPTGRDRRWLLVLRALGLGDFLTGLPALRALAEAYPGHRRVLAVPAALEPLVRAATVDGPGSGPVVDDVLAVNGLEPLPDWVPAPDVAVNLHGRGPHSHQVLLRTRPHRFIAFAHPDVPASTGGPRFATDEHEVARWCRLLEESGIPADPDRLDLCPPPVPLPSSAHGATVVHPGAKSPSRRWPLQRWAAVARHERLAGRTIFVTGNEDEAPLAASVAAMAGLPAGAVLAGRTNLVELAALVAAAGLVLSGDTGVAHLATAVGTPSVVLFGPASPAEWGPPPERPIHRGLWAGRIGEPHSHRTDPALLAITVEQVLAAVDELRGHTLPAQRAAPLVQPA